MSSESTPHIHVSKSEGFVPSERTAAALEALAEALAAEHGEEAEVAGFSMDADRLKLGTEFKSSIRSPQSLGFCFPQYRLETSKDGETKYENCLGIYW